MNFEHDALYETENIADTTYTTKFRGFLHPLGAVSSNGPPLKVYMTAVMASMDLYISEDDAEEHKVRMSMMHEYDC